MSIVSEALSLVTEELDNPPREYLDEAEALLYVYKALSLNAQKLNASGVDLTTVFFPFDAQTREFSLSGQAGFSEARYVERRIDDAREVYEPIAIVEIEQLDNYELAGKYAIAFFGAGADLQARLSWIPSEETYNHLRIWYAPDVSYPSTINDTLALPPTFLFMLVAQAIALAMPRVLRRATRARDDSYVAFLSALAQSNTLFLRDFEEQFELHRSATRDASSGQSLSFRDVRRARSGKDWSRYGG